MNSNTNSSFDSDEDSYIFSENGLYDNITKPKNITQENPINKIINSIAEMLTSISETNNPLPIQTEFKKKYSKLFSEKIPKVSLYDYISRFQKYSCHEKNTMIISLIYIDRLCEINGLNLTSYNIHRIFFISNLIAIKYNEDDIYTNKYYSQLAGIPLEELNTMENHFLELIDYNLFIHENEFKKYEEYLDNLEDSTTSNSD